MSAVTLDSAAFTAPAGLDLGTVSGGHPEKIVKFRIGLFSYKNRRKDVFEAADDISSVSLITESIVFYEGRKMEYDKTDNECREHDVNVTFAERFGYGYRRTRVNEDG